MEMDPSPGYEIASWERGYGDFELAARPRDAAADPVARGDGARALRRRLARRLAGARRRRGRCCARRSSARPRSASRRWSAPSSSSSCSGRRYAEAHAKHYRDLTPSVPYILDYHILADHLRRAAAPPDPQRDARRPGSGSRPRRARRGPGQQEINFRFADALTMADNHVVYKNGAKEIAHLNGCSITFMAKPDHTWIGNSCHIHSSLWRDGEAAFADDETLFGR